MWTRAGVRPRGWTGSGCRFDHLPGTVLFEPCGDPLAERRIKPFAVVDLVDAARQRGRHVLEGLILHEIDLLDLQGHYEPSALIAASRHRAFEAVLLERVAV